MWSFVSNQGNKQWLWLALDTKTREVEMERRDYGNPYQMCIDSARCAIPTSGRLMRKFSPVSGIKLRARKVVLPSYIEKDTGGELLRHRKLSVALTALCARESLG